MANSRPCKLWASKMSSWSWPDSLDAVIAAPKYDVVLHEHDRTRVLNTRILPGETVAAHTHRWSSVLYVLSWGEFIRRDGDGKLLMDTRITPSEIRVGQTVPCPPLPPHSFENVGTTPIHVITIESKETGAVPTQ